MTAERALNRELLRTAGEHLGTLAEQAREQLDAGYHTRHGNRLYKRWAKLATLSKDVLEIANE